MQTYTVKSGDTLYGISNQFGVSVTDIINLNNVDANKLQIGQVLKIPTESGTTQINTFKYEVKKGDSLYSIAKKYSTTVPELIDANNLKTSNLSIGQILNIPEKESTTTTTKPQFKNYVVKKGDSLYKIAKENNIDIETLKKDNGLITNTITPGQVIQIRDTNGMNQTLEVEECFGEEFIPKENENYQEYTVKKGDSLYKIAKQYNVTVDQIINLNNLKSSSLSIGEKLKIPKPITISGKEYIVKKGDNLYSIARIYNTTPEDIMKKNNLTSNMLSIGQKIII